MNIELTEDQIDVVVKAEIIDLYKFLLWTAPDDIKVQSCLGILEYYMSTSEFRTFNLKHSTN